MKKTHPRLSTVFSTALPQGGCLINFAQICGEIRVKPRAGFDACPGRTAVALTYCGGLVVLGRGVVPL